MRVLALAMSYCLMPGAKCQLAALKVAPLPTDAEWNESHEGRQDTELL